MGTRAGRTVASLGLFRCLRRWQLHSDHGAQIMLPPAVAESIAGASSSTSFSSSSSTSSCSGAEGRIDDGGPQELRHVRGMLLDLAAASRVENASKPSMQEPFGVGSWRLCNSQGREADECLGFGGMNGWRFSRGIQRWNGEEEIAARHGDEPSIFRDQDLFSRYLQWGSYNRSVSLVESRSNSEAAAVSSIDVDGLLSVSRENCEKSFPSSRLLSSSSLDFLEEPSEITPLEASSVKRKRKKKMNKHKQRKLRRRDRHRN